MHIQLDSPSIYPNQVCLTSCGPASGPSKMAPAVLSSARANPNAAGGFSKHQKYGGLNKSWDITRSSRDFIGVEMNIGWKTRESLG